MGNLKPIQQKQFLVFIGDTAASGSSSGSSSSGSANTTTTLVKTYFTKATAPKESRDEAEYNDGQTGTTYVSLGFTKREKVTLSKPFDPVADKTLVTWYKSRRSATEKFTTSIKPVAADQVGSEIASAGTLTLTGCEVASFKMPDVDRMATGVAMLEIEIVYDEWVYS